jgi:hypothetical protein
VDTLIVMFFFFSFGVCGLRPQTPKPYIRVVGGNIKFFKIPLKFEISLKVDKRSACLNDLFVKNT